MRVETFPFLENHTCLLTHNGCVYKLKLLYGSLGSTVKQILSEELSRQNAHCEIEDAFRAVLYILERDQKLCTIQTDHFIITPGTHPWALKNKIIFKMKDKALRLCPDFIVFKIQCKRLLKKSFPYSREEATCRTSKEKGLERTECVEVTANEELTRTESHFNADERSYQSKLKEDGLLHQPITRHGPDELFKNRSLTAVQSTPNVQTDQVEGSLSPQKVCQLSRIIQQFQDKVSKDESKPENKSIGYHASNTMRSESHARSSTIHFGQSQRVLRSAVKTDEKDSCIGSSTETSDSESTQVETVEKGDTDNTEDEDSATSNGLDAVQCESGLKSQGMTDHSHEDRASGISHSSEQKTAIKYKIASNKKRQYRKAFKKACRGKRNRNTVSTDSSEEGTLVKEKTVKCVNNRTVPLKRKNKEALDNIRLEKLFSDDSPNDMLVQREQITHQDNKNETNTDNELVNESDENCSDTEIAVVTENILLPRTSALNAGIIKSSSDTDSEFASKIRRISPRRTKNLGEICGNIVPPLDKSIIKTNKNKYIEVCETGTSVTYSLRNKCKSKRDKIGRRAESSSEIHNSLTTNAKKYRGEHRKCNRIKPRVKNRTKQRITSLPGRPVATKANSVQLRKRKDKNTSNSELKDKRSKSIVSKPSRVTSDESKKKTSAPSVLKTSVMKNSKISQSKVMESLHIKRITRSVSHEKASKHHVRVTQSHSLPRQRRIQQVHKSLLSSPEKKYCKTEVTQDSKQVKKVRSSKSISPVLQDRSYNNNYKFKPAQSDCSSISLRPRKIIPTSPQKAQDLKAACKRLIAEKDSVWIFGRASRSMSQPQKTKGKKSSYHLRNQRQDNSSSRLSCVSPKHTSKTSRPQSSGIWSTVKGIFSRSK